MGLPVWGSDKAQELKAEDEERRLQPVLDKLEPAIEKVLEAARTRRRHWQMSDDVYKLLERWEIQMMNEFGLTSYATLNKHLLQNWAMAQVLERLRWLADAIEHNRPVLQRNNAGRREPFDSYQPHLIVKHIEDYAKAFAHSLGSSQAVSKRYHAVSRRSW